MSTSISTISWLPEDLTGKAAANFVQNEVHKSETMGALSRFVIIPAQGAFYDTENLKVVYHTSTSDTVLQRDNDYRLIGIDLGRTKVSSATGGVYHFILISTVFNYDPTSYITIDYQAFGGYMSFKAYSLLLDELNKIESQLLADGIITADNIAANETIVSIVTQLQALCTRLQYAPTVEFLMRTSAGDAYRWKTIAISNETYDNAIDFDDPSTLTGMIVLSIFSVDLNMKVALNYDLTQAQSGVAYAYQGKLKADVLYQNITQHDQKTTLEDEPFFTGSKMYLPKFRIMVNRDGGTPKVYLQMMLVSYQEKDYLIHITDSTDIQMSDLVNKYVLTADATFADGKNYYTRTGVDNYYRYTKATVVVGDPVPSNTYYELDNTVLEPNLAASTRFELCQRSATVEPPVPPNTCTETNAVLVLKDGYKIWEGNVNLAMIESMSWTAPVISEEYNVRDQLGPVHTPNGYPAISLLPGQCLEAYTIRHFIVEVYDRYEQRLRVIQFNATDYDPYTTLTSTHQKIAGACVYYPEDLCTLEVHLSLDPEDRYLKFYAKSGKSSRFNKRFDLRKVSIL